MANSFKKTEVTLKLFTDIDKILVAENELEEYVMQFKNFNLKKFKKIL